jgi:hypothetical protein
MGNFETVYHLRSVLHKDFKELLVILQNSKIYSGNALSSFIKTNLIRAPQRNDSIFTNNFEYPMMTSVGQNLQCNVQKLLN